MSVCKYVSILTSIDFSTFSEMLDVYWSVFLLDVWANKHLKAKGRGYLKAKGRGSSCDLALDNYKETIGSGGGVGDGVWKDYVPY